MKIIGIIPARYASSRFPGKSLAELDGKPIIQWVYERCAAADSLDEVCIATDDEKIYQAATAFGAQVVMTGDFHESGTDRCAEAASAFSDIDGVINIQGDEPFILPDQIDALADGLRKQQDLSIVTMAKRITNLKSLFNENVVKVTFDHNGRALYFSRHPIPFCKNHPKQNWLQQGIYYKHIGLYGYRKKTLAEITQIKTGQYHKLESLEQLKWLEHGYGIGVLKTDFETIGIDTPEDLEMAKKMLNDGK